MREGHAHSVHTHGVHIAETAKDEKRDEKESISETNNIAQLLAEDDLDPVALNKAFKFATNSSVALVSGLSLRFILKSDGR